jgi:ring-1,2-phenylacetyl-CoA epoxidase subunit PaaA
MTITSEPGLQSHFDETIDRDRRIEPRDWVPAALRRVHAARGASD